MHIKLLKLFFKHNTLKLKDIIALPSVAHFLKCGKIDDQKWAQFLTISLSSEGT